MDDRTDEFRSLAKSLPVTISNKSSLQTSNSQLDTTKSQNYSDLRDFHGAAAEISRDIAGASTLLSELSNLVRHHSLFDDDSSKINQLVLRIKTKIESLNTRIDRLSQQIASKKRNSSSQASQEAFNIVDGLKTEFAQAATGFKQVLQQRTDTLKESETLQKQVYGTSNDADDMEPIPNMSLSQPPPVFGSNNGFPTIDLTSGFEQKSGEDTSSALPRPHGIQSAPNSNQYGLRSRYSGDGVAPHYASSFSPYDNDSESRHLLTPLELQRLDEESGQLQTQLIPSHDYLQQRADAMSTVESQIAELGTIFHKLANLVSEHREMVQRVEDNVDDANANVNLSLATLTDTFESLRSNRQLAMRLMAVLAIFIILFIVFFA